MEAFIDDIQMLDMTPSIIEYERYLDRSHRRAVLSPDPPKANREPVLITKVPHRRFFRTQREGCVIGSGVTDLATKSV